MLRKLFERQPVAMIGGAVSFALFLVTSVLAVVDRTEVLGTDRWIKPTKFFISIAIFMWTIGVYLYYLQGWDRFARRISWGLNTVFVIEMVIITGQAARGVRSHFNIDKPIDAVLYTIMGTAIACSTLMTASVLYAYLRGTVNLSPAMKTAMRLGLGVSLIGTILGGYMSAQTGHTVGAVDGGPGLPFVNWSRIAGDLRVAHFLGLHGLQAIPIFALVSRKFIAGSAPTIIFAILYTSVVVATFVQALTGHPLI